MSRSVVAAFVVLTLMVSSSSRAQATDDCVVVGDVCAATTPGTADNTVALIVVGAILGTIMVGSLVTFIAVKVWEANHLTWEHEEREREQARRDDEAIADHQLQKRREAAAREQAARDVADDDDRVGDAPPAP
ncbi:MAG TPA: hypothetical protein VGF99_17925 [Myxococcota bacterium]